MDLTLFIWRQKGPKDKGRLEQHQAAGISPEMSFPEMLDQVNEGLIKDGKEPIAFDHDCREGICGMCSQVINGIPHGPQKKTTVCQLHMRNFRDRDTIYIEPGKARAFPVIKDLIVDRGSLDRIIQSGGYVSVHTGGVPDANTVLLSKEDAELPWMLPNASAAVIQRRIPRVELCFRKSLLPVPAGSQGIFFLKMCQ